MAEETKPAPSRHRLEKLTEDYIGERRKRRGESVRRILGMPVAPETTVSEMAEFNKAMAMHMKEITAFQNKVFDPKLLAALPKNGFASRVKPLNFSTRA